MDVQPTDKIADQSLINIELLKRRDSLDSCRKEMADNQVQPLC